MAGLVSQVIRTWRRRRAVAKQDAFVEAWKTAWTEGCHRRWQGDLRDAVPQVQDDQHAAWLAGWQWADTHPQWPDAHPNRRRWSSSPETGVRPSTDRLARLARGARRGLAGLTLLAVAGWWWRRRGTTRLEHALSREQMDDPGS